MLSDLSSKFAETSEKLDKVLCNLEANPRRQVNVVSQPALLSRRFFVNLPMIEAWTYLVAVWHPHLLAVSYYW